MGSTGCQPVVSGSLPETRATHAKRHFSEVRADIEPGFHPPNWRATLRPKYYPQVVAAIADRGRWIGHSMHDGTKRECSEPDLIWMA